MTNPKNYEVLADALTGFAIEEDWVQDIITDYISCPSADECDYDGGSDHSCCTSCKVKWLLSEWEG